MSETRKQSKSNRKKSFIPPINHWHSTYVMIAAFIVSLLGAGILFKASAIGLSFYGTSNWIRYAFLLFFPFLSFLHTH